jgi:integrase
LLLGCYWIEEMTATRGHLRQRGNGWELRVYAGKDPVTGTERYVTKTIKGCGKREAERALNELVVAAERGALARTRATVGELLDAGSNMPG